MILNPNFRKLAMEKKDFVASRKFKELHEK